MPLKSSWTSPPFMDQVKKNGWVQIGKTQPKTSLTFSTLLWKLSQRLRYLKASLQMQITSLDFSSFTGRIAIGRVTRGQVKENMPVALCLRDGSTKKARIKELMAFEGLGKTKIKEANAGEIVAVNGIEGFEIGDTIADAENQSRFHIWRSTSRP